jgi:hypothetical protein
MTALAGDTMFFKACLDSLCRMQGTPNARVLPEPVSATLMASLPAGRNGQAADCIGVGQLAT